MSEQPVRVFYRLAHGFPPPVVDHRTARDKRGIPPTDASEEVLYSWDGLSAFDTEEAARRMGQRLPGLGRLIVRYLIPEDAGIGWRQTGANMHHWDLRFSGDEGSSSVERQRWLEPFLDRDYLAVVNADDGPP